MVYVGDNPVTEVARRAIQHVSLPLTPEQFYHQISFAILHNMSVASMLISNAVTSSHYTDLALEACIEQDSPEAMHLLMRPPSLLNLATIERLLQMALLRNKEKIVRAIPDLFRTRTGRNCPYSPVFTHLFKEAILQKKYNQVRLLCELNQKMGWGILERDCDLLVWATIQDGEVLQILEGHYPPFPQRLCNAFIYAAGEGDQKTVRELLPKLRDVLAAEAWVSSPVGAALEQAVSLGQELIIRDLFSLSDEGSRVEKPTPKEVEHALHMAMKKKSPYLVQLLFDCSMRRGIFLSAEMRLSLVDAARAQGSQELVEVFSARLDRRVGSLEPFTNASFYPLQLYHTLCFAIEQGNMRDAATIVYSMRSQHPDFALEAVIEGDSPEGIRLLLPYSTTINLNLEYVLQLALLRNKEKIFSAIPDLFKGGARCNPHLFINLFKSAIEQKQYRHVQLLCELNRKMGWGIVEREYELSNWQHVPGELLSILQDYYPSVRAATGERSPIGDALEKAVLLRHEPSIQALFLNERAPNPEEVERAFFAAVHVKSFPLVQLLIKLSLQIGIFLSEAGKEQLVLEAKRQCSANEAGKIVGALLAYRARAPLPLPTGGVLRPPGQLPFWRGKSG
jgi:hypothetical protein